ncbi:MAG: 4-(cytidine 5'-diphospho)-2-C-methyl-D-erythritol kinase [Bacteroidetes bacterium]|nr:MAG: 4-(cytidine 5'-diphospho)-2-C-methyl-D-erythritol kinase [Bacteroidota bacterium]
MIVFPKAKINIGLRITGNRPDGYHDIETVFYPVGLSDALEFVVTAEPSDTDLLTVSGISTGCDSDDNLVIKTVRKLRANHSIPFLKIHLHKAIPVGAGLGGGSSDAAFLLKALNKYFRLSIDDRILKALALESGSDCPFFIDCVPAFATGRGEILSPVNPVMTGYYLLLLNPGIGINTREAYENSHPENPSTSLNQLVDRPITEWRGSIINDFEDFAFKKHPLIGEIKNELYNSGAIFSSMSGSGSSVYGIFAGKISVPDTLKDFVIYEGTI